eukprot:gene31021-37493_t
MGTWLCYDNVIPIYLEYIGSAKDYQASSAALAQVLGFSETTPLITCLKTLRSRGLYALIVADEIEQVYTGTDHADKRRLVLDDLAELGSQATGRAYTYLCGSSSLVPVLISKNAVHSDLLCKEFPFVCSAPILNGKKYVGLRIHRGLQGRQDLDIIQRAYNVSSEAANLSSKDKGRGRTIDRRTVTALLNAMVQLNEDIVKLAVKD